MDSEPWELPARRREAGAPPSPAQGLPVGAPAEPWELPARAAGEPPTEPVPVADDHANPVVQPPPEAGQQPARWAAHAVRPSSRTPARHPRQPPSARAGPVAAVLALALVVLGAAWLARESTDASAPSSGTASSYGPHPGSATGAGRGAGVVAGTSTTAGSSPGAAADGSRHDLRLLVARVRVPAVAPPARDAAGLPVTYVAAHLVDGDPSTAWRMRGNARGRSVTVTFMRPVTLARVGLVNGYAKVDRASGIDRYRQQRRVTRVLWRAGAAAEVTQDLADGVRTPQLVPLAASQVRELTLTILATVPGNPRFDFTSLGEIELEGA